MAAHAVPRSVGDIDTFITMLRTACEDELVYQRLERLLSLSDSKRRALVHAWVSDLLIAGAPSEFAQAVACLADDAVAEKAYEVIYRCRTEDRTEPASFGRFPMWLRAAMAAAGIVLGLALAAVFISL